MVWLALHYCALVSAWANAQSAEEGHGLQIWKFDSETAETLPKNFVVGTTLDGRSAGEWKVIDMTQSLNLLHDLDRREHTRIKKVLQALAAPSSPHVLAQLKNRGFEQDYNVVLVQGPTITDCDLTVSMLPVAGKADMGGGLIWRAQDAQNFYITRANPLEQNIRLYRVVKGVRYKLANIDHIISVDTWHTFRVVARGDHFQIIFDGQTVLDVQDETFQSGQIGLWTKADAVTFFDDLRLSAVK
jgi:3-keto-disaccharide hydrolase